MALFLREFTFWYWINLFIGQPQLAFDPFKFVFENDNSAGGDPLNDYYKGLSLDPRFGISYLILIYLLVILKIYLKKT